MARHIWRTIAGGVFFGVLPLLIGWKFNIAGVSLTGPAACAAAAAIGVSVALVARFSVRRGVRDLLVHTEQPGASFERKLPALD